MSARSTYARGVSGLTLVLVLGWHVSVALADAAAAEALFRKGRELLDQGRVAEACSKFEQSQQQDASAGTLFNLASCHEKQGKTATAWAEFLSAARLALAQGRTEQADLAQKAAEAVEAKLSYLTIESEVAIPGLEIHRGDVLLEEAALGTKIPVDPGTYEIGATAPGYEEWSQSVTVNPIGDERTIRVPELHAMDETTTLQPEKTEPPATIDADASAGGDASYGGSTTAGWIVGGIGLIATGVGSVFGVMALVNNSDAEEQCGTPRRCDPDAIEKRSDAEVQANIANVGIGVGVAAMAVGIVLLVSGNDVDEDEDEDLARGSEPFRVTANMGPYTGYLQVSGAF